MRYFVIGPDGSKYGPADVPTLNTWATENRVLPTTMLEEEGTGRQVMARDVIGLIFPMSAPVSNPTPPTPGPSASPYDRPTGFGQQTSQSPQSSNYYRPQPQNSSDGNTEVIIAWILGVIGLGCCPIVFSTIGIVLAIQAKNKGNPGGQAAMIFCIVSLIVGMGIGAVLGLNNFARGAGRF